MRDEDGQDTGQQRRTPAEGEALVVAVLRHHGDTVLRIARRHSACDEDAADASQRALEIFVRHARRLDEATAYRWLFRVVRNEAVAVHEQRHRHLAPVELEVDALEARHAESPEERVLGLEATAQAAEALLALKTSELQALVMQASGDSYARIAQRAGWSGTKVNRVITEGRRRLREQRDAIVDGRECERWAPVLIALVDGRASARDLADVRPHLRNCIACRAHVRSLHRDAAAPVGARARLTALAPLGLLGWLTRAQDAVLGGIGERMTSRALQVQGAAEALSVGKFAAVAASAAALATGGAAVAQSGNRAVDVRHRASAVRPVPARSVPGAVYAARAAAVVRVKATAAGSPRGSASHRAPRGRVSRAGAGPGRATPGRQAPEFRGRATARPASAELVALSSTTVRTPASGAAGRELRPVPAAATRAGEFSPVARTAPTAAGLHPAATGGGDEFAP